MAYLLDQVRVWIETIILTLNYPGIALVMFLESVFPPIPSELVMPFAGFLVAQGKLNFAGAWLAGTIGTVLGALVLYGLGSWFGDHVVRTIFRRYGNWLMTSEADYEASLKFFARFGVWAVLLGRIIPIVRSLISIPAGMEHMRLTTFLIFTTLGSAAWSGALALGGMVLGSQWDQILGFISTYERIVLVLVVLGAIGFAIFYFRIWRERRATGVIPK